MNTAVIPAAGYGRRMQSPINKQFLKLNGMPIVARTVEVFRNMPEFAEIIVVFRQDELEFGDQEIIQASDAGRIRLVAGGATRQESVYNALQVLNPKTEIVLIHDGARPLVDAALVRAVLSQAQQSGAAIAAVPVKDTIKVVEGKCIVETPERKNLWAAQTPQAFSRELILKAHSAEKGGSTDDAALVEGLGHPVNVVSGSYKNIKITTPEDLVLAQALLGEEGS